MDACGADLICNMLSYLFDAVPSRYLPVIQVFFYPVLLGGTFWMGTLSGRGDKEGFINGIMYYLNIQVYNDANIPYSIDEDAEQHVKEAKRRLVVKYCRVCPSEQSMVVIDRVFGANNLWFLCRTLHA